jgi:hypothetical protein
MKRQSFELAHAIKQFAKPFVQRYNPNPYLLRTLSAITQCRTSSLGGHVQACDGCGQVSISYNSCRNRHCPKCQGSKQMFWVEDLMQATLPVKHYHIVFTLPHELNQVCLLNSAAFYNLLFAAAWDTLRAFGYAYFGTETGAVCVLHTWGQNLSLHPHLHCIVPAAGISLAGNWKNIAHGGKYLYPVPKLSVDFRSHFMKALKTWLKKQALLPLYQSLIDTAWNKSWVVHLEPSMAKPDHVVRYLGQYTHKVAISNSRILDITDNEVTFLHKDYTDYARQKPVTLDGVEFLHRFCMHILPRRFVKIRRFGVYSHTYKAMVKKAVSKTPVKTDAKESTRERLLRITGFDIYRCPVCKQGHLHCIRELPAIRAPGFLFPVNVNYC